AAIVPGKAAESELLVRVASTDPEEQMPPPDSKLGRLTPTEIATLKRWIEEGAPYQTHWAFAPLTTTSPGSSSQISNFKSQIDQLVSTGLVARPPSLQPEADRETLLPRVPFDLTGLPPTLAEIDAFLADRTPDAFARVVDRLLASPRYGERMTA